MERCAGNPAVVDVHEPCTGRCGKLGREVVPCLPRRDVGVDEHARLEDGLWIAEGVVPLGCVPMVR